MNLKKCATAGTDPRDVELGDFFLELGGGVFEFERYGALVGLDEGGGRVC
jgi:hypothetical protein